MASRPAPPSRVPDRIGPALGVVVVHAVLGYALIAGLKVDVTASRDEGASLVVLDLMPPPLLSPETEPPPKPRRTVMAGGGSTATLKPPVLPENAPPAPVVPAPPPVIMTAPPVPADGSPAGNGENGSGTGGTGAGTGRGDGSGQGAGSGQGGEFTSARQIRGRFRNSDFPASARSAGRLRIGVRYTIGPSGRIDGCEIIESSSYPEVDAMTCRVIIERYRFKPARDEQGVPVAEVLEEDYSWRLDR